MKKRLLTLGIITAVGTAGAVGVGVANAATDPSSVSPMSGLVDAIASKFSLNKSDVQKVFDEQHSTMQQQRETDFKSELAQLVKDGKLTQDQADKLTAKRAELQKQRDADRTARKDKTREEMKSMMDTKRAELEQWAKDNGISTDYLHFATNGRHGGMMGDRGHRDD